MESRVNLTLHAATCTLLNILVLVLGGVLTDNFQEKQFSVQRALPEIHHSLKHLYIW